MAIVITCYARRDIYCRCIGGTSTVNLEPFPVNAFSNRGTPILANRVPRNPPCCVFVGLITNPFPVWRALRISFFCPVVSKCLYATNCAILSIGTRKPPRWPFPNILSTPKLAKPDKAPVARVR